VRFFVRFYNQLKPVLEPTLCENDMHTNRNPLVREHKEKTMKNTYQNVVLMAGKIDRRHIQLILLILSLSLLVIGAGAPADGGGGNPGGG
jgi:hypothetical protein